MILVYYLIIINLLAFVMYGVDKKKAEKSKYRIPESRLIAVAVLGGAYGAGLGMLVFHHKTKKTKFRVVVPTFLVLNLICIGLILYGNYHLVNTEYEVEYASVPDELDGYRIVQVSDLHNQFFGFNESVLLKKIEKEEPDIIVVTGDVVDSTHTNYGIAESFFKGAVEIAPVYYISGNHEEWLIEKNAEKYEAFIKEVESYGVEYIDDRAVNIDGIRLVGVSEMSLGKSIYTLPEVEKEEKEETSESALTVVLAHEPEYIKTYVEDGADLVLSGHNHGGQVRFPGQRGFVSANFKFFPELDAGVRDYGKTKLIISRGLGNSVAPIRVNNYPEIVTIVLKKDN